ncbi:MAG: hypothetical protein DCF25_09885 [Leptolyngbya foveolarum]|uniref:Uncharacterized protein n=1 Tax=Leptolyngbya foveolarum TaxID=47253 RepID=A0A2W4WGE1_9CYAN|nr:MAG: hypothetical protein DCF25_09885 [Leptolyngbya foveolarum]
MGWSSCIEDLQTKLDDFINRTQAPASRSRLTSNWHKAEMEKICKVIQDTQYVLDIIRKEASGSDFELRVALYEAAAQNKKLSQENKLNEEYKADLEAKNIQLQMCLQQMKKQQITIKKLENRLSGYQRGSIQSTQVRWDVKANDIACERPKTKTGICNDRKPILKSKSL